MPSMRREASIFDEENFMRSAFLCAAAFLAAAGAGPAVAADLAVRPLQQPLAPPPYVPDWAGF
jgi:hypothetical protein